MFEQVLAADDFEVFYQVMLKRNMLIQEQCLVLIIRELGGIPESLLPAGEGCAASSGGGGGESMSPYNDEEEDRILQEVLR